MGFALRNQRVSAIRKTKFSIGAERAAVLLRKLRGGSHGRKIRTVKVFGHAAQLSRTPAVRR